MIIAWPGNNKLIHKLCLDGHSDKKKFQEKGRIVRNDDFEQGCIEGTIIRIFPFLKK